MTIYPYPRLGYVLLKFLKQITGICQHESAQ
jgi:hypothetical protein